MCFARLIFLFSFFFSISSIAQELLTPAARWTNQRWDAYWIVPEGALQKGVFHFRKGFNLTDKPAHFIIHVSADSRYRLYVNGNYVNDGPQISDRRHWRFESLDIAHLLEAGQNVIAFQAWNLGEDAAVYDMGKRVALIVQGDDPLSSVVNTDNSWKYIINNAITPIVFKPGDPNLFYAYYAAGPMDKVSVGVPWNWEKLNYDDSKWLKAGQLQKGNPFQVAEYGDAQLELLPRSVPLMERTYQPFGSVRRSSGIKMPIKNLNVGFTIQPNQKISLLIDQGKMTTAFPEWTVSKGNGSEIKVTYAEAMMNDLNNKGHRDSIQGKEMHGIYDLFYPDGGEERMFTTLSFRAFRFMQVDITTKNEALIIDKAGCWDTGYPFQLNASFTSSDPELGDIFKVGWHTARLCAHETYMDCPYWERLQYIGDTRIQALVSYYNSGDDRLARNALEQFEWSMQYDGLTYSRYPSSLPQFIPNYSLVWVLMVNDYLMYRNDPEFVKSFLPGMKRVLDHFKEYLTSDKMMQQQPYWDFIDHTYNTKKVVDASLYKKLTTNSLFYAYTLSRAAEVFSYFDETASAREYGNLSQQIKESVKRQCWDGNSNLFADTPDKKIFSAHSNILAVLCGIVPKEKQEDLLKRVVANKNITQTTLYFDFYLARAMNQAQAGDLYYDLLSKWKAYLKQGLTTFPEGVSRSDCHAWSASPNFEMLAMFAGIESATPGFKRVLIRPQLQKLDKVSGTVAHWAGKLEVSFEKKGKHLSGSITLPPGITGRLEWGMSVVELKAGVNVVEVE